MTIFSLHGNDFDPYLQVMCVILDGKPRDVKARMTRVLKVWQRPMFKVQNAGEKAKYPDLYKITAREAWREVLPSLTQEKDFNALAKATAVDGYMAVIYAPARRRLHGVRRRRSTAVDGYLAVIYG
ncbi:hypothetical protein BCR34DRAFT_593023 [Clohesyomyces aquaticus]|uniref:Uncharacterized protein n=1 Tax=Clohesyomyces aquaticus TaxID=1231657 RepID=A0A1Y1YLP0_9PLEO|nr:hypothetical protein BCR34DRAFT_593023 [Clohesyomyces aquaticus]